MMQTTLQKRCPTDSVRTDCTKDFILPDSYPDIRKLLYTAGSLVPERCQMENGKLSVGGNLICKLLFSDENDELHSVNFTLEYSAELPVKDAPGEATVISNEVLQGLTARAVNPRKVNLRGKIEIIPRIFYEIDAGPDIASEISEASLEKQCKALEYWKLSQVNERSVEASEDLSLPDDLSVQEILFADLNMGIPSSEATEGSIRFSGEAALALLFRSADGALHFTELPIPYHSSTDANCSSDALCMVRLLPEAISCLPAEDASGEAHGVELDFSYSVTAWVAERSSCNRVTDCYSVDCSTLTEEGSADSTSALRKNQKQQRRMLSAPSEGMKKCLKCFSKIHTDSLEKQEDGLTLHCIAEVTVLGCDKDDKPMSLTLTEAFPWTLDGEEVNVSFTLSADPVLETDEIKISLSVNAEFFIWQNASSTYITGIAPDPAGSELSRGALTLCYPQPGEGVWEIAKQYRLPQSVLLAANSIGDGPLPPVLLIPEK